MKIVLDRLVVACFGAGVVAVAGCSGAATSIAPLASQSAGTASHDAELTAANIRNAEFLRAAVQRSEQSPSRIRSKSWLDRKAFARAMDAATDSSTSKKLLYAVNSATDTVDIFPYANNPVRSMNQAMIGQLTGFEVPTGIAIDRAGDLFVADYYGKVVYEFTTASMPKPSLTIPFPQTPYGVAVDDNASNVYVTGEAPFPNGQLGVAAYKMGATTPFKYLTDSSLTSLGFPYLDNAGAVYIAYGNQGPTSEGAFRKGSTQLSEFYLTNNAYQGELDNQGDLLASDEVLGSIDTYPNGSGQSNPSGVQVLPVHSQGQIFFDLNRPNSQIFAVAYTNGAASPIMQFAFPSGTQTNTIQGSNSQYLYGIVTYPADALPKPYYGYTSPSPQPSGTP